MKKYILALSAIFAMISTSCKNSDTPEQILTPAILISEGEVGQGSLSFFLNVQDAVEVGYMIVERDAAEPSDFTTQNVVDNSVKLESAESQEVSLDGLKENVDYQVIAYCKAKGNDVPVVTRVITMHTTGLQLAMGFFAYDGVDEASGRHRVTFMGSTRPRYTEMDDYMDITLFMYLLYDPGDVVTEGVYEPYMEDFSNVNYNCTYKPGKRVNIDGEPNMQGSGWWLISKGNADDYNCAHAGTQIITRDDEKGTTTINGTMIDQETNLTLNFTYTTDEPMFRFDDY